MTNEDKTEERNRKRRKKWPHGALEAWENTMALSNDAREKMREARQLILRGNNTALVVAMLADCEILMMRIKEELTKVR